MKESVTLSSREIQRIHVLERVCRGALTLVEGTPLLRVCYRQAKRLLVRYREEGAFGLAQRRRGQPAHNAYGPEMRDRVLVLHQGRYAKFNDTHFVEMLAEREDLRIGRETVRRWLRQAGLPATRRRGPPRHPSPRPRPPPHGRPLEPRRGAGGHPLPYTCRPGPPGPHHRSHPGLLGPSQGAHRTAGRNVPGPADCRDGA